MRPSGWVVKGAYATEAEVDAVEEDDAERTRAGRAGVRPPDLDRVGVAPKRATFRTTGGFMNHGKRYRAAAELARRAGLLRDLKEAVSLVKQTAHAKFDETIVISSHLGVDPRHSDQLVRGTVVLPHGTGKNVRVLVLCKGDKQKEALAAGADHAGSEEFVKKSQEGWPDADAIVATPDSM